MRMYRREKLYVVSLEHAQERAPSRKIDSQPRHRPVVESSPAAASERGSVGGSEVAASAATTTSSAAVSAPAAAAAAAITRHLGQTGVNLLLRFRQDGHEVTGLLCICVKLAGAREGGVAARTVSGEECNGSASLACTTGPADAVNVVLGIVGVVVVQHMRNVANILNIDISMTRKRELQVSGTMCGRVTVDASLSITPNIILVVHILDRQAFTVLWKTLELQLGEVKRSQSSSPATRE